MTDIVINDETTTVKTETGVTCEIYTAEGSAEGWVMPDIFSLPDLAEGEKRTVRITIEVMKYE